MDRPMLSKKTPLNSSPYGSSLDAAYAGVSSPYLPPGPGLSPLAPRRPAKIFRYDGAAPLFAGDWSVHNYVALGSFNEEPRNSLLVVEAKPQPPQPQFVAVAEAPVTMPQTKVAWEGGGSGRLLSSGDTLRLWRFHNHQLQPVASYAKRSKSQPHVVPAPLTSFDWSRANANKVLTSSIDTTCTLWDLASQTVTTQLIAHDQEVNDVAFLAGDEHQFVSVGADGSARLFDLRALDNSTIIYEAPPDDRTKGVVPMLRVAPSPADQNVVCAFGQDQTAAVVLDIRATRNPLTTLDGHQAPVNCARWLPHAANLLATGGDDCQLLLWDVGRGALLGAYNEFQQINMVLASPDGNWLGSVNGKSLQAVSTQL